MSNVKSNELKYLCRKKQLFILFKHIFKTNILNFYSLTTFVHTEGFFVMYASNTFISLWSLQMRRCFGLQFIDVKIDCLIV